MYYICVMSCRHENDPFNSTCYIGHFRVKWVDLKLNDTFTICVIRVNPNLARKLKHITKTHLFHVVF